MDIVVDEPATRGEIDRRLAELERLARDKGSALGLAADISPVLVDRVAADKQMGDILRKISISINIKERLD